MNGFHERPIRSLSLLPSSVFQIFFLLFNRFFFFLKYGARKIMQRCHLLEILLKWLKVSKEPGRRILTF